MRQQFKRAIRRVFHLRHGRNHSRIRPMVVFYYSYDLIFHKIQESEQTTDSLERFCPPFTSRDTTATIGTIRHTHGCTVPSGANVISRSPRFPSSSTS